MDNKKFEQLIELILNENEEQARSLFHDIVVEKSREIYESMMDEEMGMDEGMGGQVGDLLDEISAEEEGMTEEEDMDMDIEADGDDEMVDIEADDMDDEIGEEELEDRVVDLEDKLDQLMAEFEELMGSDDDEEMSDMDDEEMSDMDDEEDEEESEEMMEAVQLQKVSVTHGDNGVQTKSPGLSNSGQAGMDSKPVKFSGDNETVPTGPKGPSNAYAKGETQVKGAGSFKNAPGHKGQDLDKAPAASKGQSSGMNDKSPVAESKKTVKKIVK